MTPAREDGPTEGPDADDAQGQQEQEPLSTYTVVGFHNEGYPVAVGVVEGAHQVSGGQDEYNPWADQVEAENAQHAQVTALTNRAER